MTSRWQKVLVALGGNSHIMAHLYQHFHQLSWLLYESVRGTVCFKQLFTLAKPSYEAFYKKKKKHYTNL